MPQRSAKRDRNVYLFGAGVSQAFKLPNTSQLLERIEREPGYVAIRTRMNEAFRTFFPDSDATNFRPEAMEFFLALNAFCDMSDQWSSARPKDPLRLVADLNLLISSVLLKEVSAVKLTEEFLENEFLTKAVSPGNIIITTNWDTLVEEFAAAKGIRLRFLMANKTNFYNDAVTLLKIHGSADWTVRDNAMVNTTTWNRVFYRALSESVLPKGAHHVKLNSTKNSHSDSVFRFIPQSTGNHLKNVQDLTVGPFMVTMSVGKAETLAALKEVWHNAFRALIKAECLTIAGYSMPVDDVDVRVLLRAGIRTGARPGKIVVKNPSPEVHARMRSLIDHSIISDYGYV